MRMLILALLLSIPASGQTEDTLTEARALYKDKKPQQAITLLNDHLNDRPDDLDARVLLGLICSWEKRWDDGRRALAFVLKAKPDYKDAVLGLINLERWSGHALRAEEVAQSALATKPEDADYKAAIASIQTEIASARVLSSPSRPPQRESGDPTWETGIEQNDIFFSDKRSSWHETSVNLSRDFTAGWVTATFSHTTWYGQGSNLIDLQSYPSIRPGTYGFIDVAFSPDATLYARRRLGGEIYQSLPRGFEASAGFRYMRFDNNIVLYTASVGKWFGNYWILGRTYVDREPYTGPSKSYQVSFRRYFTDADHFIGLRLGEGASPFEIQNANDLGIQRSSSAAFEALWKFRNQMRLRTTLSVARQTRLYIGPLWQYEADCTLYFRY